MAPKQVGRRSPLYNNPRYRCCGVHVEKWALALALLLIVLTVVETVLEVMHTWWNGFLLLEVLVLLLIFPAQRSRRPWLYFPFLIFQAVWILLFVLYFVNIVLSVAWSLIGHKNVLDGLTQTLGYHYEFYFQQQNETAAATVALETTTTGGDVTGMSTTTTSGGEVNATLVTEKQVMEGEEGNTATKPHSSIAAERVLTLVDIGVALVYTLLVVVHYYVVVKAWRYLRDERRAERTVVPARVHPAAGNGGGNGSPTAGGGPNIQRFP